MMRQFELVDRVAAYVPNLDEDFLNRAYVFAVNKHGSQKRASGDPYFSHPVEVAGILTELKLDPETIVTGLLHDTLEDTDATPAEITDLFGEEVTQLVDGVTKLSLLETKTKGNKQAENFRKFLIATASDIRILIVKLADRLHNMRTLHFIDSEEKRKRIARETMDVFAPLAGRMGIHSFREELEDLAFQHLNPEGYALVKARLVDLDNENSDMLENIAYDIHNLLAEQSISSEVKGRQKKPFSIWRKMENKSIALEQLSDVFGIRILTQSQEDCYRVLGAIHQKWSMVPGRFKDYISVPKSNNYQSLHTTIIGPGRQRVEVQIRTHDMDAVAEKGVAAHWVYKEKHESSTPNLQEIEPFKWLQELVGQLKNESSAEEFMENTKLELFHDRVFCFTPKGRLIALPDGATPIDFAYAVHTAVGNKCVSAKINGNPMPLRTRLRSGDEVEIITDENAIIPAGWEQIAVTGKARAALRHERREREFSKNIKLGEEIIESVFRAEEAKYSKIVLERALDFYQCDTVNDLFMKVGAGEITGSEVLRKVYPSKSSMKLTFDAVKAFATGGKGRKDKLPKLPVVGVSSTNVLQIAPGCYPLPGDEIVGIAKPGLGIFIYPIEAKILSEYEGYPDRWIALQWDIKDKNKSFFASVLDLTIVNKIGALGEVCDTIAAFQANINNLKLTQKDEDFCILQIEVMVKDVEHVKDLISALRGSRSVSQVSRQIG
ncbi:MAG: RelA/SpoT family protein [Parvibaculales bacterium]